MKKYVIFVLDFNFWSFRQLSEKLNVDHFVKAFSKNKYFHIINYHHSRTSKSGCIRPQPHDEYANDIVTKEFLSW
jgi:hypothetical protein